MSNAPGNDAQELARVRLERDLYLRLLELGKKEDLAPFLEEALALVVDVTGAKKGFLEVATDDKRSRFVRVKGFSEAEIPEVRRQVSSGIIAEALGTGKTLSTASAIEDPRFAGNASVQAQRIQAVLCAPIAIDLGGPALGVLYLQGRDKPGPFPEQDRAHAEMFARHLAPFVDRLVAREAEEDSVDHTRELRARLEVADVAGTSRALAEVFRQVLVAAPVPIAVLVTGESGTGKTKIARALHQSSPRASGPFVEVNCAAIPETLFESELFGAEKGAHSTATRRIDGKIDAAKGGTLFLDEVGEIPLAAQSKLLMFLQSRRYYRLGGATAIEADVRVIAATNANLEELVREKRFREDLYYRLNVLEVRVPPLRERRDDVPAIADQVVRAFASSNAGPASGPSGDRGLPLSRAARVALGESDWPGNVRQLENVLARGWAIALSEGSMSIEPKHLFPDRPDTAKGSDAPDAATYEEAMRRFQAKFIREALETNGWNVSETARRVGLARSHLNDLIKAHGLVRKK